ncbi:calcium-binding protein, partial [uncultured Aliiroseovarius sp.]|uniref:calcium-binding protein n=1 Tax=uncultured Aliiroseovarius sp. TaxID=1658783 RepID=UPI00259852D5
MTDLEIHWEGETAMLYSTTGAEGGGTSFEVTGDGAAQMCDEIAFTSSQLTSGNAQIEILSDATDTYFVSFGGMDTQLSGHAITASGDFQPVDSLAWSGSGAGGRMSTIEAVEISGTTYVYTANIARAGLSEYELGDNRQLQIKTDMTSMAELPEGIDIVDFATIEVGGTTYLLAASNLHQGVVSYELGPNGHPIQRDTLGAADGVGISSPTAVECAEFGGVSFVVIAAAGSSSLTVLQAHPDGSLLPVDHIIDNLNTRFDGVTELEIVEVEGRVYVLAGGADDGISLFVLGPNGQLIHVDTLSDDMSTAMQNVSALAAEAVGGAIQIFATSESEEGITQLRFNPGNIGQTVGGDAGGEVFTGTSADDLFDGAGGDDILNGGGGDDILIDGAGQDILTGGTGDDVFVLVADGNHDVITDFDPTRDTLDLTGFNMLYDISQLTITLTGYGCDIQFRNEGIEIHSANGQPLTAGDFQTTDMLFLDRPPAVYEYMPLTLSGSSGADTLEGRKGDDTLFGEGGNDVLIGGEGSDYIDGGSGKDTASYAGATTGVQVSLADGTSTGGAGGDTLVAVESLIGSGHGDSLNGDHKDNEISGGQGNDVQNGGGGNDTLNGDDGNDQLNGEEGNDQLNGGTGNDILNGGKGADVLNGGDGVDTASYAGETSAITVNLGNGFGSGAATGDSWIAIENISGTTHADTLFGNAVDNVLSGGDGGDILSGGGGADTLYGNTGQDVLFGGAGADILVGGAGDDVLDGGASTDQLMGGAGADVMDGGENSDVMLVDGTDIVTDTGGVGYDKAQIIDAAGATLDLSAWSGVERVNGHTGDDVIDAGGYGAGLLLFGAGGDDTLTGTDQIDVLIGGTGNDTLNGGAGNDWLLGSTGDDVMDGGDGSDVMFIGESGDAV